MKKEKIFIFCGKGDNYSPYWNYYYNPESKKIECEGSGVSNTLDISECLGDYENLTTEEIVDELKDWLEDRE